MLIKLILLHLSFLLMTIDPFCLDGTVTSQQGHAETFGGTGAQSIKEAHGTWLLIGLFSLLIFVSKWMLLY